MKLKIFAVTILILCFCVLCGCEQLTVAADNMPMFVKVEEGYCWYVVYHKETKVMYVVSDGSSNRGDFTVLVDEDGQPMLWEG